MRIRALHVKVYEIYPEVLAVTVHARFLVLVRRIGVRGFGHREANPVHQSIKCSMHATTPA